LQALTLLAKRQFAGIVMFPLRPKLDWGPQQRTSVTF